jgi:hypothetical protein
MKVGITQANAFQLYGLIEVIGGTLKLCFMAVIIVVMIVINQGAAQSTGVTPSSSATPK